MIVTAADRRGLEPQHHQGHPDTDSRYPAADMPLLQTHSIVLTFRIDYSLCFQLRRLDSLPSPPFLTHPLPPGAQHKAHRGEVGQTVYPASLRVKLPRATTPGTLLLVQNTRKASPRMRARHLPLIDNDGGGKRLRGPRAQLLKKRQSGLTRRGPVPPEPGSSWKEPTTALP